MARPWEKALLDSLGISEQNADNTNNVLSDEEIEKISERVVQLLTGTLPRTDEQQDEHLDIQQDDLQDELLDNQQE